MTRVSWENVNRDQHNAALVNRDQCNAALDFGVACTDPVTQIRKETSNDKMMMTKSAFFLLSVVSAINKNSWARRLVPWRRGGALLILFCLVLCAGVTSGSPWVLRAPHTFAL